MKRYLPLQTSRYLPLALAVALLLMLSAIPVLVSAAQTTDASVEGDIRLLRSSEAGVQIEVVGPDYTIQRQTGADGDCQQVALEGYELTEFEGKPSMPVRTVLVGAPPNSEISLQVAARRSQPVVGVSDLCQFSPEIEGQGFETSDQTQQIVRIVDMGFMRSQRLLRLEIYPFQVNALNDEVIYHQQVDINLSFQGDIKGNNVQEPASFESMFQANILNYDSARRWRADQTEPPVLGAWTPPSPGYKIPVREAGLVVLTKEALRDAGLPVDALDPRTLKMFFMGEELAIIVTGEQDGSLDENDTVLFYAESVDTRYTDTGVYWLSYDGALGKRMGDQPSVSGGNLATAHTHSVHSEENRQYIPSVPKEPGFDHWYGLRIDAFPPAPLSEYKDYVLNLEYVAGGELQANLEAVLAANVNGTHHLRLYVNGNQVHDDTWEGRTLYQGGADFPQSYLQEGDNTVRVELVNDTPGQAIDQAFVDWLRLTYQRYYQTNQDWIVFGGDLAGSNRYQIDGFTSSDVELFDITNLSQVKQITGAAISDSGDGTYRLQFGANEAEPRRYLALTEAERQLPAEIIADTPSTLQSTTNGADYIVLSHRNFIDSIQPLVTQRENQGMRTIIVDVQDAYDEFGYGMMSAEALRDFLAYTYQNWESPAPADVLLVGDGTYDMRLYLGNSAPTYLPPFLEMVDFDRGETATDNRFVAVHGDDILPDMNVGRLPVNSDAETQLMVEKILSYETLTPDEAWTKNVYFVADNLEGGGGNFYELSDSIADGYVDPPANTTKLLPEEYARTKTYMGQTCPSQSPSVDCRQEVIDTINAGTLMVSYIGHGSKTFWAAEKLYDIDAIQALNNGAKMPIMLPMTCNEGYFHEPKLGVESTSEAGLRKTDGGSVASWAPTGYGLSTGHDYLERGLFLSVFHEGEERLGANTTYGKLYLIANAPPGKYLDLIDTFLLLGDPALRLPVSVQEPERTLYLPLTAKELRK